MSKKLNCVYENTYDFEGVVVYDGDKRITSLWVDTREKSAQIITLVDTVIEYVQKKKSASH